MTFSVLFVCTGNICRSPAAELMFRARVTGWPVTVHSAGTSGLSGHEMDRPSALAVRELGLDPSGHVARRLSPAMVEESDLVLTADSEHRALIVRAAPLAFRRTFTMREFARLGADLAPLDTEASPAALRARVAAVAAQRGWVEPAEPGADDIGDPFGAGLDVARQTVQAVAGTIDDVITALGLEAVPSPPGMRDSDRESTLP